MLRTYFQETFYDMPIDVASKYADAIRNAIRTGQPFDGEKRQGYFVSRNHGFDDKLYVGNIHRIENHLYWHDEKLADDDEIINVVMMDGPITRDGDGCSYGSKDHRDQILYANTIPQVKGHIFFINTPGGAASSRIDYEQAIADCREKGKPTVAFVDGMCCSAGQLVAALCDRTVVMNGRHTMGCIGTMCAFWGVSNGAVTKDGFKYIELVSVSTPDKNAEYREAVDGKTEKLQAELDKLGEEFRNTVRQNRPLVKEEHLTGKTFDADEVMGALVDEIGNYDRAIEAVFELAGGTLTAARLTPNPSISKVGEEDKGGGGQQDKEQDETVMDSLSEQQRAAIAVRPGGDVIVDDGKVEEITEGMFGTKTHEVGTTKNENDMKENENENKRLTPDPSLSKSGDEDENEVTAVAQQSTEQEETDESGRLTPDPSLSKRGEEGDENEGLTTDPSLSKEEEEENEGAAVAQQSTEQEEGPAVEQSSEQEETPAGEQPTEQEETPAVEQPTEQEEADGTSNEDGGEGGNGDEGLTTDPSLSKEEEEENEGTAVAQQSTEQEEAAEDPSEDYRALYEAVSHSNTLLQDEMSKLQSDMEGRAQNVRELEEEVKRLTEVIAGLQNDIREKDAEIIELSGSPSPMLTSESGIPTDNGTGQSCGAGIRSEIRDGMSPAEMRAACERQDQAIAAKRKGTRYV